MLCESYLISVGVARCKAGVRVFGVGGVVKGVGRLEGLEGLHGVFGVAGAAVPRLLGLSALKLTARLTGDSLWESWKYARGGVGNDRLSMA